MEAKRRKMRRQQLDSQFASTRAFLPEGLPSHGWIRSIRESIGMSLGEFARRIGVASSTANQLEKSELSGSITLNRLRNAANAIDCDVAILVIPRRPLAEMVEDRARSLAINRIGRVKSSMAMENQGLNQVEIEHLIQEATQEIIDQGDPELWS